MGIPSELGYGERGSPPKIGGGAVLVFQMEIIKIKGGKVPASRCDPKTLEDCDKKEIKYIKKLEEKFAGDTEKLEKEIKRLKKLSRSNMKKKLKAWVQRRLSI